MPGETAEIPDPQREIEALQRSFNEDLYENIGSNKEQGQITPADFLKKYAPLLSTDRDYFSRALGYYRPLDHDLTYVEQLMDIGQAHLKGSNLNRYQYLSDLFNAIGHIREAVSGENIRIPNSEAFLRLLFKKALHQAAEFISDSPLIFLSALNAAGKTYPELGPEIQARYQLKSPALTDENFRIVANYLDPDGTSKEAREMAVRILLSSQEQPFSDPEAFKSLALTVLYNYPSHQSDELVELVLRRGNALAEADPKVHAKIAELLAESSYGKKPAAGPSGN